MPNHVTLRSNGHGMFRFNHFVHHAVRESLQVTSSDILSLVTTLWYNLLSAKAFQMQIILSK
jgi:hypothetical protein